MFSVRIVSTDHYQSAPIAGLDVLHSDFRSSEVKSVPVIRIFGATPAGQKTCLHLHGIFPYIYVPYDGTEPTEKYLKQFASSIDRALQVATGRASAATQHVFKISLVSGIPFYGYHAKEEEFMKIYFYNPQMVKKAVDLLHGGAIMNKHFQPFEAHIPYLLQVFMDYNLYGMNLINLAAVKFRRPRDDGETSNQVYSQGSHSNTSASTPTPLQSFCSNSSINIVSQQYWDHENIPSSQTMGDDVARQSTCELEVDGVAADITNRTEIQSNIGTNPGLAAIWEDEKQRRRDNGESSQIAEPLSPEREDFALPESEAMYQERLREIIHGYEALLQSQIESEESFNMSQDTDIVSPERSPVMSPLGGAITRTPSSAVELHCSQFEGKDLPADDEESEDEAIIDEEAVHSILETSQSFRLSPLPVSQPDNTQDRQLVNILAQLADESGLEENSILSGTRQSQKPDESDQNLQQEDEEKEDEEDSILMSQIWHDEEEDDVAKQPDDDDYVIPQVDGGADDKTEAETQSKKSSELTRHYLTMPEKTDQLTVNDQMDNTHSSRCANELFENNIDNISDAESASEKTFLNLDNINIGNFQEDLASQKICKKLKTATSCQMNKKHSIGSFTPKKKVPSSTTLMTTPPKDDTLSLESMLTNIRRSASKISMTIPSIDLEPVVLGTKPPVFKNTKQPSLRMEQKRAKLSRRRQLVADFPRESMQNLQSANPENSTMQSAMTVTQRNAMFPQHSVSTLPTDNMFTAVTEKTVASFETRMETLARNESTSVAGVVDEQKLQKDNNDGDVDEDIPQKTVSRRSTRRAKKPFMRRRLSISSDSSMGESNWNRGSDEDYREDEEDAEDDDFVIETRTLRTRRKSTKPKKKKVPTATLR